MALNARRAAEEATGQVRWLRPEFQDPARRSAAASAEAAGAAAAAAGLAATALQAELDLASDDPGDADPDTDTDTDADATTSTAPAAAIHARRPWPTSLPEQMRAVADALAASPAALGEAALGERFSGRGPWKKRLPQILQTLEALGRARAEPAAAGPVWRAA